MRCIGECSGVTLDRISRGLCPVTNRESEPEEIILGSRLPQMKGSSGAFVSAAQLLELLSEYVLGPNTCLIFHRKRLKAKNLMYIKQILYLLERFVAMLGGKQTYFCLQGC